MRSHGVTNFPDPTQNSNGQFSGSVSSGSGGVDPNSPTFQAAQQACQKYQKNNTTPAQQAQHQAQLLKYAQCMRSHGVPNFPDPTSTGGFDLGPSLGINPQSSTYKTAESACQSLAPGGSSSSGS